MSYYLEKAIWSNIFAVPCEVVDKHLKLCGETALKVLLLLLRAGGGEDVPSLIRKTGKSEQDVRDALSYWRGAGVLSGESPPDARQELPGTAEAVQPPVQPPVPEEPLPTLTYTFEPAETPEAPRRIQTLSAGRARLSTQQIGEMSQSDENIAFLLQESQSVLGKPLNPVATDTVVGLYSYYGMQPDLVLMLLQYCVTIGKDNMRYVEKVAASWLEKGIDSHEKAEAEILRATELSSMEGRVKSAFGIFDRKLINSEQKFIAVWTGEYGYGLDIITLAFERAVEQKGKLSFPYINGILANWHSKGIATAAQAKKEIQERQSPENAPGKNGGSSYDLGEVERMLSLQSIIE